jgi:hypothetical protein
MWGANDQKKEVNLPEKGVFLAAVSATALGISAIKRDRIYDSVLFGKIYSINHQKSKLVSEEAHRAIVEEYLKSGPKFLTCVEGVFLLSIYDYLNDELSLINDVFGSVPLNYYIGNDQIIFSSQLKSIQTFTNTDIDELSLAEYLSMGITLDGKTLLKNIYRMWPGTVIKINNQKSEKIQYFEPWYEKSTKISTHKKIEEATETFSNSINDNFENGHNTAAALSGGFDSRLIWSILYSQNQEATATTFGERGALDIELAGLIAEKLDISHEIFILTEESLRDFDVYAENVVESTEGFTTIENAILVPYYKWLMTKYQRLIDGTGSALYRRQVFRKNSNKLNSKNQLPDFIINSHNIETGHSDPDKNAFITSHMLEIHETLDKYFNRISDYGSIQDLLDLFYLHHYIGFRFSSDLMLQLQYIDSYHPFCNASAYQQIRRLSVSERRRLLFHKHAIHRFEPRLESFYLVNSGILVPYFGYRIRRVLPVGLTILKERYGFSIIPNRYKRYPVFNIKEAYQNELYSYVKDILLDKKTRNRSYWNAEIIEKNLYQFKDNIIDFSSQITNLITIELFFRKYIDL